MCIRDRRGSAEVVRGFSRVLDRSQYSLPYFAYRRLGSSSHDPRTLTLIHRRTRGPPAVQRLGGARENVLDECRLSSIIGRSTSRRMGCPMRGTALTALACGILVHTARAPLLPMRPCWPVSLYIILVIIGSRRRRVSRSSHVVEVHDVLKWDLPSIGYPYTRQLTDLCITAPETKFVA